MRKTRQDNHVTDRIGLVYAETELNCHDLSDQMQSMMKTRLDNSVNARIGILYTKNDIKLLWLIKPSAICDEN